MTPTALFLTLSIVGAAILIIGVIVLVIISWAGLRALRRLHRELVSEPQAPARKVPHAEPEEPESNETKMALMNETLLNAISKALEPVPTSDPLYKAGVEYIQNVLRNNLTQESQ